MSYRPKFSVTPHLIKLIEEISALRERIVSAAIQVPWLPTLQKDAKVRNTHSSTAIEGNPLSLMEVEQLADGKDLPLAAKRSRQEILNYFAGLRFIEKSFHKKRIAKEQKANAGVEHQIAERRQRIKDLKTA